MLRRTFFWTSVTTLALIALGCSSEEGSAGRGDDDSAYYDNSSSTPTGSGDASGALRDSDGASSNFYAPEDLDESPQENEDYSAVGTNPFVLTSYDPLSTFAADVDTASYDIFRRDVGAGTLPDPASVRLEEYVNYFVYDYPAPAYDAEVPFSISLAAAPNVLERETVLLRVGIQGQDAPPADTEQKPANLVFLVDVSGSMSSAEKLPLVQQVLLETLDVLQPTDTISIVTYASGTAVLLPPTPVSDRATIEEVITELTAGGSTAGAAGLDLAYQQAEAAFIEGGINHVLLCTDGDFNVGPSSNAELVALIEEKRESGITLTVLGFGIGNLNDSMMEAVSNAGNGVYGVITDSDQATRYVNERLLSTMTFIAKDMKIQVEFNASYVYAYRLLGYENRALADEEFRDDAIDAGEVGAGHRVTALYELVLEGGEIPLPEGAPDPKQGEAYTGEIEVSASDLLLVKVRYKKVNASAEDPAREVNTTLAPEQVGETYTALDGDFQWAIAVAAFAEILKQSPYADPAALPQLEAIVTAPAHAGDPDRAEFAALFDTASGLLAP